MLIVTTPDPHYSRHPWDHSRSPLYRGIPILGVCKHINTAFESTIKKAGHLKTCLDTKITKFWKHQNHTDTIKLAENK